MIKIINLFRYTFLPILLPIFLLNTLTVFGNQEIDKPEKPLFVGVGKMNITPSSAVKNWVTGRPYTGVEDSLYVYALVLSDGDNKAVIVSWDLVDAGESATDEVRKAISEELNIPEERILVNATHNHSAPWTPVYSEGYRGEEKDTWWAIRHMANQNTDPSFKNWMDQLLRNTVSAARQADDSLEPSTLWIGRTNASEYMNNRRPRLPAEGIGKANIPEGYNYGHQNWNPDLLLGGATFGPLDRTMTLVSFRDEDGRNIVSLFHLAIHAVSIYPFGESISADWPGEARKQISNVLSGEAIFIQGTAGDINPWKRGRESVNEMGIGLAKHAENMYNLSSRLKTGPVVTKRGTVSLPLNSFGKERTGLDEIKSEVQVISLGSLALVTLPGEPLTDLGTAIREQSPFSQTLVLGYSNGNGVHYVGMPGEKARGGYEMDIGTVGTDAAGAMLVELALQLLKHGKR